jgi:hypothetical protein
MKAHFEYTLLRGGDKRPMALDVGSLAHLALEAKLKGEPWAQAVDAYLADLPPEVSVEVADEFNVIAPSIALWEPPDDWEILGTEVEMEIPCGRHTIVGRLDAPIRWNNAIWHLQHKTLSPSIPIGSFCEQQRTDWHESVYHRMLQQAFPLPNHVEGTVLNIIRKLSTKRLAENPLDAIVPPQYLPRTDEIVQEALDDLSQLIDDIEAGRNGTRRIIKCRSSCSGPYRNSLCIYKPVCDGDVSIESDSYVDLEPRYADV